MIGLVSEFELHYRFCLGSIASFFLQCLTFRERCGVRGREFQIWVTTMACRGVKLKVTGQGQESRFAFVYFCMFRLFVFIIMVIVASECQG